MLVLQVAVVMLMILMMLIGIVSARLVAPWPLAISDLPEDLSGESIVLDSESGSQLPGWYLPAKDSRAVVVLVHPYRGSRLSMLNRARLLIQHGCSVVMTDLQAHGESKGDRITLGYLERHDVEAAVEYARKRHPNEPLALIGFSMGGAATLLSSVTEMQGLVLEAVYPTIRAAILNRARRQLGRWYRLPAELLLLQVRPRMGVPPSFFRPIDRLPSVDCPVFIMGGTADPHTTAEDTKSMYAAARAPKQLWMVDGAVHEDLYDFAPREYEQRLLQFLEDSLQSTAVL